jgi:hypothetical protein
MRNKINPAGKLISGLHKVCTSQSQARPLKRSLIGILLGGKHSLLPFAAPKHGLFTIQTLIFAQDLAVQGQTIIVTTQQACLLCFAPANDKAFLTVYQLCFWTLKFPGLVLATSTCELKLHSSLNLMSFATCMLL